MPQLTTDLLRHAREIARCYRDPFYFATRYCFTQKSEGEGPLVSLYPSWPYLEKVLHELADARGDHLWDKSRQMLLTWTFALHELHQLTFTEGYHAFNLSRKAQLVDDGGRASTPYSIHGRIRFMWERLPHWLRSPLSFATLKITNDEPGMGGLIVGESANPNAGRSGAYLDIFADEVAAIPQGELVHASLSGCTYRARHYVSTPKSGDNVFTRLRKDDSSGFHIHTIPWDLRPDRDEDWYAHKAASMLPWQRAQELDINYEGAAEDRIYPHLNLPALVVSDEELPPPDKILHTVGGQDWGFAHQGVLLEGWVDVNRNLWVVRESAASGVHVEQRDPDGALSPDCWLARAQKANLSLLIAGHDAPAHIDTLIRGGVPCRARAWGFEQGIMNVAKLMSWS